MNKRVEFTAVDNGITTMMDKLRRSSDELMKGFIRDAQQYSETGRDQIKFIEDQIRAIERRNRLEKEAQQLALRQEEQRQISQVRTQYEKDQIRDEFREKRKEAGDASGADDMQLKLLRELIETVKLTAREEIAEDRKDVEEKVRGYEEAVRKGKEGEIDEETRLKRSIQRDELSTSGKEGGGGIFGDVLAANLVTEVVKGIGSTLMSLGSKATGAQSGEQFLGQALTEIPVVGGFLGGAVSRTFEESFRRDVATKSLFARTGTRSGGFGLSSMGLSEAEAAERAERIAVGRGSGDDLASQTRGFTAIQQGLNIDEGTLMSMLSGERIGAGDLQNRVLDVVNVMRSSGVMGEDMSRLQEILEFQNNLIEEQSQVMESVDSGVNNNLIRAFQQVGGSFADQRAGQRMSTISRSLSSPQNDFQQAMNMMVLGGLEGMEGASFLDILKAEEKGIAQEGFLSGYLGSIVNMYGGGDQGVMGVQKRFSGLSYSGAQQLLDAFQDDPTLFDNLGEGGEGLRNILGEDDLESLGVSRTTERERSQARISDSFTEGIEEGLLQVGEETGKTIAKWMRESGVPMGEEIGKGMLKFFNSDTENKGTSMFRETAKNAAYMTSPATMMIGAYNLISKINE